MSDGFLGYHATLMLDIVVCALILIVPTLLYSLFTVKVRKNYVRHRNLQIALGVILLVAVGLFEIDIRLQGGIDAILVKRTVALTAAQKTFFDILLAVHLVFAISTPFLWATTLTLALKRFSSPPAPGEHSRLHKRLGWLAAVDITLTAVTGLLVYYFGFVV